MMTARIIYSILLTLDAVQEKYIEYTQMTKMVCQIEPYHI